MIGSTTWTISTGAALAVVLGAGAALAGPALDRIKESGELVVCSKV